MLNLQLTGASAGSGMVNSPSLELGQKQKSSEEVAVSGQGPEKLADMKLNRNTSKRMSVIKGETEPEIVFCGNTEVDLLTLRTAHLASMSDIKEKLRMYEIALNRAAKSVRDIETKLGIKQTGVSSIARSGRFVVEKPNRPIIGKVAVPDIMGIDKLAPANQKKLIATELIYTKIPVGIRLLGMKISDGQKCIAGEGDEQKFFAACQKEEGEETKKGEEQPKLGASDKIIMEAKQKKKKLPKDIKRIEVQFQQSEAYIFQIRFFQRDGSQIKIGGSDIWNAGRTEVFTLESDEVLLGAEFDHTEKHTVGVTWIKWNPGQ